MRNTIIMKALGIILAIVALAILGLCILKAGSRAVKAATQNNQVWETEFSK